MKRRLMLAILFAASWPAVAADHPQLKPFHAAAAGMERFVIELPDRGADEARLQVEIIPGRVLEVDGVNRVRLAATLAEKILDGWGYPYYEVSGPGEVLSTLMAVPPGTEKKRQFVAGTPQMLRYNSRLPVVVYVPQGDEIRYRIWTAPAECRPATKK